MDDNWWDGLWPHVQGLHLQYGNTTQTVGDFFRIKLLTHSAARTHVSKNTKERTKHDRFQENGNFKPSNFKSWHGQVHVNPFPRMLTVARHAQTDSWFSCVTNALAPSGRPWRHWRRHRGRCKGVKPNTCPIKHQTCIMPTGFPGYTVETRMCLKHLLLWVVSIIPKCKKCI